MTGRKRLFVSLWTLVCACGFLGVSALAAQDDPAGDDDTLPVRLCGWTKLAPPAEAENQDATGSVKLRQWGERMAIHVYVRHLEPGATYNVSASRTPEGQEAEVAELGTITTHDGVPPAPRCFRATLKVVEPVEELPEGEEEAGEGGCFGRDWHLPWDHHFGLRGMAVLMLDEEGTTLEYNLFLMGASDAAVTASINLGGDPAVLLDLPLDERLKGSVAVTSDQLAILASGEASLVVTVTREAEEEGGEAEVTELAGTVKTCFPEEWREKIAVRRAGTGALRLDTEREDAMPFGVTNLEDLVGATISVKDGAEAVVLAGTVEEFITFPGPRPRQDEGGEDDAPAGGGGGIEDEADVLEIADDHLYFEVPEIHDASFLRGDVNEDSRVNLSDPIALLGHLFLGAAGPYCRDSADANDNGEVDLADPIVMLLVLFQGQATIAGPYPQKGFDHTADALFCGTGG